MSTFMGYAMAASHEALEDAGWKPKIGQEQEMTVSFYDLSYDHSSYCEIGNLSRLRNWQFGRTIRHLPSPRQRCESPQPPFTIQQSPNNPRVLRKSPPSSSLNSS